MSDVLTISTSPFVIRHALLIALEATYADLAPQQTERLRTYASHLPKDVTTRQIGMDVDTLIDFAICMRRFKETQTWCWLRDDLKKPIMHFEQALMQLQNRK